MGFGQGAVLFIINSDSLGLNLAKRFLNGGCLKVVSSFISITFLFLL